MYRVELTTAIHYKKIKRFDLWVLDKEFFIFYWEDGTNIKIKKDYIISIEKYEE